ncbi:unnamed protein product [Rotaria magnacalcarata]|uniref:Uncharacterized protein n=3 Tax=Rotaria magnacalcarata TaxID=392030 RepID=A0A816WHS8_9BILA|nr:unnamed protein product [Rotaria magnacalcarata]CAF1608769.1 unnamed protein product [Rotaria magnacalcarata]CAF2126304.1 unnamed protein product [Rotaria magnacalcarata]CAF4802700.1 unnamed protein product [Rotaria magnacalcarata]
MANLLRKQNRTQSVAPPSTARTLTTVYTLGGSKRSKTNTPFKPWGIAPLWIQSISKEESTRKQWEKMHGWMADYDCRGNFMPRKHTLENSTRFSNTTPNSHGHDYGWHLQTQFGKELKNLQTRYDIQHKKRARTEVLGND